MAATYKAVGINLKAMPMGESDRLLTVLTREFGLIRAVAPGSRKHESNLRGRSGIFAVNQLLIVKGRNLDKIIQADGVEFYGGLSQDLRRLTASQYLAELALFQALSDQPQEQLFDGLRTHLQRLETLPAIATLPYLTQAVYHLLALAGLAPRVHHCCLTQRPLVPDYSAPDWRVGFSAVAGGVVSELEPLANADLSANAQTRERPRLRHSRSLQPQSDASVATVSQLSSQPIERFTVMPSRTQSTLGRTTLMTALELEIMQYLSQDAVVDESGTLQLPTYLSKSIQPADPVWLTLERMLRTYAQYHFEQPIRSASLIETCFSL
jgi:DNA repair protein RecO (recombination protein O)